MFPIGVTRHDAFAKHVPYMESYLYQNRVVLKDNKRNRIAEVMLKEGELQCLLDERADCVHVGFAYSLPELYNNEIKVPTHQQMEICPNFPQKSRFRKTICIYV